MSTVVKHQRILKVSHGVEDLCFLIQPLCVSGDSREKGGVVTVGPGMCRKRSVYIQGNDTKT